MRAEGSEDPRALEATFRERAAPPGTPPYYALLFAAADLRAALAALFAFEAELRAAVHPSREHTAAHLKLAWWSEEVERIAAGSALHPIGRALLAVARPLQVDLPLLRETLAASQHDLAGRPIEDREELLAYCERQGGIVQQIAATLAEPSADRRGAARRFGSTLGQGLRLAEVIRHHRSDIDVGRVRLPRTLLTRHSAAPADFLAGAPTAAAVAVLDELAELAIRLLDEALAMTDIDRQRQRSGRVLGTIAISDLERMRRGRYSRQSLTPASPLRLLFTSWRAAQRK